MAADGPVDGAGRMTLVLGGARSGKSRHAQALAEQEGAEQGGAEQGGGPLVFVATAQAFDAEMADRIARHRADRDARWTTVEAPMDLAAALDGIDGGRATVLIDCLTLWASNLLLAGEDMTARLDALLAAAARRRAWGRGRLILVANEVGLGIVPDNALARRFRDMAGIINQRVAAAADEVVFLAAGLPLTLKAAVR